jgi:hypothetical protein
MVIDANSLEFKRAAEAAVDVQRNRVCNNRQLSRYGHTDVIITEMWLDLATLAMRQIKVE